MDTGAAWTTLGPSLAEELGLLGGAGEEIEMSTRLGSKAGRIERISLALVSDPDEGESLVLDVGVFVCEDWPEDKVLLGYEGLLRDLRFAVDPAESYFYFGSP